MSFTQAIRDVAQKGSGTIFLIENEPGPDRGQISRGDWPGRQERRRGVSAYFGGSRHEDTVGHSRHGDNPLPHGHRWDHVIRKVGGSL
jgi:hypothetical protein